MEKTKENVWTLEEYFGLDESPETVQEKIKSVKTKKDVKGYLPELFASITGHKKFNKVSLYDTKITTRKVQEIKFRRTGEDATDFYVEFDLDESVFPAENMIGGTLVVYSVLRSNYLRYMYMYDKTHEDFDVPIQALGNLRAIFDERVKSFKNIKKVMKKDLKEKNPIEYSNENGVLKQRK